MGQVTFHCVTFHCTTCSGSEFGSEFGSELEFGSEFDSAPDEEIDRFALTLPRSGLPWVFHRTLNNFTGFYLFVAT